MRAGLDAMSRDAQVERTFIAMGDQPEVDRRVPERLLETMRKTKALVVVPRYRYAWSNPALVDRSLWSRLMGLTGDQGAQRLFKAHPEWVEEVWFDLLPPRDVDTREDVEDLTPRTER
jgi:molybdenum cofactor cytidylyltransferase